MSNLDNFSKTNNPITGTFGTGQIKYYYENDNFVVPAGISAVRVRLWGAGGTCVSTNTRGSAGGGGGGFALKTISGLTSGASIAVTVGTTASASSSFGAYVSATGGATGDSSLGLGGGVAQGGVGGTGVGGDINNTGGKGGEAFYSSNSYFTYGGGGGCAGLTGKGGDGGGGAYSRADQDKYVGGAVGAHNSYTNSGWGDNNVELYSDANVSDEFDISNLDLIGTGKSSTGFETTNYSSVAKSGINGAGGIRSVLPATPGGGSHNSFAQGLVVVEY